MAAIAIDFRKDGNAKAFLGDGWSSQEPGHIWAIGDASTLVVPNVEPAHDWRLTIDVFACVPNTPSARRKLDVVVGGQSAASYVLGPHRTKVRCVIAKTLIPDNGTVSICLEHPDPMRPSDYGGVDTRPLAVAFIAATLEPLPAGGPSSGSEAATAPSVGGSKSWFAAGTTEAAPANGPLQRPSHPAPRPDVSGRTPPNATQTEKRNNMKAAALTFVFNESVNLPIWIEYYGKNFGRKNLYVVDRESNDGSISDLGDVNRIVIPRDAFDDTKKSNFMSSMQNALLNYYDAVVCSDADELLVPDMHDYVDLKDYIEKTDFDYVTSIGLNVLHILHHEAPLDLRLPILSQRRYARFNSATCKTLLSRVPIRWLAGLHCLDRQPKFDGRLYLFHTKAMDYGIAASRYKINRETTWSERAISHGHGGHHRYEYDRTVRELFLDGTNAFEQARIHPFVFDEEIERFQKETVERDGFFWIPMNIQKIVEIPERLRSAF